MSDRRNKERERVWGRRPVILRFDPGHPRPLQQQMDQPGVTESATSLLASFFQSVIQTTDRIGDATPAPVKNSPQWYLVESNESATIRKPIEIEPEEDEAAELQEDDSLVATQTLSKPRTKSFWRLQSPHISLNVFSPKS